MGYDLNPPSAHLIFPTPNNKGSSFGKKLENIEICKEKNRSSHHPMTPTKHLNVSYNTVDIYVYS